MRRPKREHPQRFDLATEMGWTLSAIEAAMIVAEQAEGDPERAAALSSNTHAILRLIAERLRHMGQELDVAARRR